MKVLKFGGTSVGSVESIQRVKKIVDAMAEPAIVVVSAVGGITDKLIATTTKAVTSDTTYTTDFENICKIHTNIIDGVVPADKLTSVKEQVNILLEEVGTILKGVEGIENISSKDMDLVVSYGERISSIIVASVLDAKHWNSLEIIKTNKSLRKNVLDADLTYSNIEKAYNKEERVVMGGFISTDSESGEITNLGRGGSDYTAAIVAGALNAEALEIWTDVDGFLTADPRMVRNAYTIEELSYLEAVELSNFGAKIIYPPTIYPVYEKNIPLYIRNSYNPEFKGTKISGQKTSEEKAIKGISSINDTCLITLQGMGMVGVSGISSRTFQALANQGISVFLISQASSENSTTFAIRNEEAEIAVQALKEEFKNELDNGEIWSIEPRKDLATVAIVGDNMRHNMGLAGKLFDTLGRSGINIIACAQGASETNISFVIKRKYLSKALNVLHDAFFLADYQALNIFLVGTGTVGGSLLEQIEHQQEKILKQNSVKLNVVGITDINGSVFDEHGIHAKPVIKSTTDIIISRLRVNFSILYTLSILSRPVAIPLQSQYPPKENNAPLYIFTILFIAMQNSTISTKARPTQYTHRFIFITPP